MTIGVVMPLISCNDENEDKENSVAWLRSCECVIVAHTWLLKTNESLEMFS